MNIYEIIQRPNDSEYDIDEIAFVVNEYIRETQGVNVELNPYHGVVPGTPFQAFKLQQNIQLLNEMYNYAMVYYLEKLRNEDSTVSDR